MTRLSTLALLLLAACASPRPEGPPLRVMSLNAASGAGDRYRDAAARVRQGELIGRAAVDVVALQEVDRRALRSAGLDVAIAIARAVAPGFEGCEVAAPLRGDGVAHASCDGGDVVYGAAFFGHDLFAAINGVPSGIIDADPAMTPTGTDRSRDAAFGNAFIVRAPARVRATYNVALATDEQGEPPLALLELLAEERLPDGALVELSAYNEAARNRPSIEPRAALVVRLDAYVLVGTHLESGAGTPALRAAQLRGALAIAAAEGRRGRRVVVLGDFNAVPSDLEPLFAPAGFARAAAPPSPGLIEIDQIWAHESLRVEEPARLPTADASDHPYAPVAVVRPVSEPR